MPLRFARTVTALAPLALLDACGSGRAAPASFEGAAVRQDGVAVNAFLWHASLETLSFLPVSTADPFGGIILTDWYTPPETPAERFKINVYLLTNTLRADGLKITVFRQQRDAGGDWRDAGVGPEVASEFENAVLIRARDLRLKAGDRRE